MTDGETATFEALLSGLVHRASAVITVTASTVRLAQAELKLAASSAGLIAVGALVLAVMVFCTWLLTLFTGFHALQALGLQPLAASVWMLVIQIVLCVGIVLVLLRLRRNCHFPRTREALNRALTESAEPAPTTAPPPDKPAQAPPSVPA